MMNTLIPWDDLEVQPMKLPSEIVYLAPRIKYKPMTNNIQKRVNKLIPKNIEQALEQLENLVSAEDKKHFMKIEEDDMCGLHHSGGMFIRNNWGLWDEESPLHKWFKETHGIWHADDMSGIILTSYWRRLHEIDIDVKGQTKFYLDYWKEQDKNPSYVILGEIK